MASDNRAGKDDGGLSGNAILGIGLAICGVLLVVALLGSQFFKTPPPPPPPPIPPTTEQVVNTGLKFTVGYYKAGMEEDAKRLKLPVPTVESLEQPLVYANELAAPKAMKPDKDQLDTPHLHLASHVTKEWSLTGSSQRMRVEHSMLTITNKSDRPIAYRVDTFVGKPNRCKSKAVLEQNAIALRPGESVTRSECLWFKDSVLEIRSVEVIELSDLGYFYASRLPPSQVLIDERTDPGHEVPNKDKLCTFVPWREIRGASEGANGVRWADVIDFYARHNCDEYSFFTSYRRWTKPGQLPARADAEASPATPTGQPLEPDTKSR